MTPEVQQMAAALFDAMGIHVPCGKITFNMNESQIDSVETNERRKVPKRSVPHKVLDGARRCG
jgi:hypothetical protein